MHAEREGETGAVLFVRTELPPPARDRAGSMERRLDGLETRGILEFVDRKSWEKRVPVADCAADLRDTYLALEAWATETGVRLSPFFQTRECYTRDGRDTTDWLVVPAVCLALYEDDEVTAVYPHARGDETRTVEDGIDAIAAADTVEQRPAVLPAD